MSDCSVSNHDDGPSRHQLEDDARKEIHADHPQTHPRSRSKEQENGDDPEVEPESEEKEHEQHDTPKGPLPTSSCEDQSSRSSEHHAEDDQSNTHSTEWHAHRTRQSLTLPDYYATYEPIHCSYSEEYTEEQYLSGPLKMIHDGEYEDPVFEYSVVYDYRCVPTPSSSTDSIRTPLHVSQTSSNVQNEEEPFESE
ncbi:hypothetical protein K435DRAFT_363224 [Dendrothele bispora CBS 962.96]|uniref:Uncharacterized protein n=1 Tax=Dendrothele bispora (strain CBS 962.96) TaxID=1314807 RepID=A0A4S8KXD3_DENBC|nr:hypothetical protein K435DRAFT_874342 [Dendrothele bispora CBS 962.96]THU86542.1 hypothetical protein K435DRAFT_363224 [Dendrothele bispora CBS 962.96]